MHHPSGYVSVNLNLCQNILSCFFLSLLFWQEIDLKAGSGYSVKIGEVCRMMLSKLDWFGTLFPRLPVNTQKNLEAKLKEFKIASRYVFSINCISVLHFFFDRLAEDIDKSNGLGGQDNGAAAQDDWGEAGRRAREDIRNTLPVRYVVWKGHTSLAHLLTKDTIA